MHTRWKVCFVKMAVKSCMQRHSLITESLNRHSPHTQQLLQFHCNKQFSLAFVNNTCIGQKHLKQVWLWQVELDLQQAHTYREGERWDPILTHPKSSDMSLERVHPIAARMTITIDVQMHIWQASYRACLCHHHHHHHHAWSSCMLSTISIIHHLAWALKKGCMQVEHTKKHHHQINLRCPTHSCFHRYICMPMQSS